MRVLDQKTKKEVVSSTQSDYPGMSKEVLDLIIIMRANKNLCVCVREESLD